LSFAKLNESEPWSEVVTKITLVASSFITVPYKSRTAETPTMLVYLFACISILPPSDWSGLSIIKEHGLQSRAIGLKVEQQLPSYLPRFSQTSQISPYLQNPDQSTNYIALAYRRAIYLVIAYSAFPAL